MKLLSHFCLLPSAFILAVACATAAAQDYPSRAIRIIVPSPPGGGYDLVGRVIAQKLGEQLGQQVLVENRTGAGTLVGTEAAAKSPADGYTLLVGGFSNMTANVALYRQLPYDPLADFTPAGMVVTIAYALVSRKDLPQRSLREIIEFARANPGKLAYASAGVGTGQHIVAAILMQLTGVNVVHVPYRGAQPAYQDLLSSRVDLFFDNAGTARPYVESGRVKAYAVSSANRYHGLPDVPTVAETGVADLEMESWIGIFARSGTPAPVLGRLRAEMARATQAPDVAERFEKTGARMLRLTAAEAEAMVRSEAARWVPIIRQAGIQAE